MENNSVVLDKENLSLVFDLWKKGISDIFYYGDYGLLEDIRELYPNEFKHFSGVSRCRRNIERNINAMASLGLPLYFGTLTFNNDKNDNKESYKLEESFKFLNEYFEYFVLVEEYGGDNGRYHIHFVGVFNVGYDFEMFCKGWHSRQNLQEVREIEQVKRYMVKYVSKQVPRIRRNKRLVAFEKLNTKVFKVSQKWCFNASDNAFVKERLSFLQDAFINSCIDV